MVFPAEDVSVEEMLSVILALLVSGTRSSVPDMRSVTDVRLQTEWMGAGVCCWPPFAMWREH